MKLQTLVIEKCNEKSLISGKIYVHVVSYSSGAVRAIYRSEYRLKNLIIIKAQKEVFCLSESRDLAPLSDLDGGLSVHVRTFIFVCFSFLVFLTILQPS